jgi:hypothetical protein
MRSPRIADVCGIVILAMAQLATGSSRCMASSSELGNQVPQIAAQIVKSGKKRVAVVDFTDLQGNVTELGRFLAEELSVGLAAAATTFEVIDRGHLESLLAEHRLSSRGLTDSQTALRLKVAGVQGLLTGTVIPLGDSVRLTLKVLDVETARISAPTELDVPKTPAIQALIERGVDPTDGPLTMVPGASQSVLHRRQVVHNVAFDLKGCRSTGGRAVCNLAVTSLENDGGLYICGSRAMDDDGSELATDEVVIGGSRRWDARLVAAVPMSLRLGYPLPGQGGRLALLEVSIANSGCGDVFHVQFRAIPLTK